MFIFGVTSSFQKFLKGGDIHINVAILHAEVLNLGFCLDSFGNVHEGVFESFGKFFPEFSICLGVSMGQLPVYGFLLLIGPIFNFSAMDVAKV